MGSIAIKKGGISADAIKLIAIMAMLIDHIAWAFVPLNSFLGFFMHTIGRITMPIMSFFIAEGFHHTKNIKKYVFRLLIFALISQIPFTYFQSGKLTLTIKNLSDLFMSFNVLFTLMFGLLALWIIKSSLKENMKEFLVMCLLILSFLSDWMLFGVFFILIFGLYPGNFKRQIYFFSLISLIMVVSNILMMSSWYLSFFQLGIFLSLPLLYLYNGKRSGNLFNKWIFYIFYPAHILIIGLLKYM